MNRRLRLGLRMRGLPVAGGVRRVEPTTVMCLLTGSMLVVFLVGSTRPVRRRRPGVHGGVARRSAAGAAMVFALGASTLSLAPAQATEAPSADVAGGRVAPVQGLSHRAGLVKAVYAAGKGGSVSGVAIQRLRAGKKTKQVVAQPDTAHHFVSWSDGVTAPARRDKVVKKLRVTAQFDLNTFGVRYTAGPGGSIVGASDQTVAYGADATAVTAVPDAGHTFERWSDGGTTNPRTDNAVVADRAVTAQFANGRHHLHYAAAAGGTVEGDREQQVAHGANGSQVTAVAAAGYEFVRWSDGSTTNPRTDTDVTTDLTITAVFTLNQYAVTYSAGPGGSIAGTSPQTVDHGADATAVSAVPDAGYRFVRWSDGRTTNPRADTDVSADLSVTAQFAVNEYAVRYSAGPGGTVTGQQAQTVNHGADATTVTAVPDTGHHFLRWSDGRTTNPRTDTALTGDLSVTAQFAIDEYTVTYAAGAGGSIDGTSPQTVTYGGAAAQVRAVADAGYHFVRWSDGNTSNPRTDTDVTADLSVTAVFSNTLRLAVHGDDRGELASGEARTVYVENPDTAAATYLLVPTNIGTEPTQVSVGVRNNATLSPSNSTGAASSTDPQAQARAAAVALAQSARGGTSTGSPLTPAARLPLGVPTVGSAMALNRDVSDSCTTGSVTTATVQAVGARVVIVTDDTNPSGGLSSDNYNTLRDDLDTVINSVTDQLGSTSDLDANSRIVVFLTRSINTLPANSPGSTVVPEFSRSKPVDLLTQTECPTSNVGEIIYGMAPDPSGTLGTTRTVASVMNGLLPAVARDLAHQVMDTARFAAGTPLDGTWLSEAVADVATDAPFYARATGLQPLRNIMLSDLTSGPYASLRVNAFNTYVNNNFNRLKAWLQAPEKGSVFAQNPTLASRGGAWAFLNYAADRMAGGSLADRTAFLRSLITGAGTGTTALATAINADPDRWLEEFVVAAYTDDEATSGTLGTAGPYARLSWNYRSVYSGLGGYPLATTTLDANTSVTHTYAPDGGGRHLKFVVPAGGVATLTLTAGRPDPSMGYRLVRFS